MYTIVYILFYFTIVTCFVNYNCCKFYITVKRIRCFHGVRRSEMFSNL